MSASASFMYCDHIYSRNVSWGERGATPKPKWKMIAGGTAETARREEEEDEELYPLCDDPICLFCFCFV